MSKIEHDKYYTPLDVVQHVVNTTKDVCNGVSEVIEPSAGNGAFIETLENSFNTTLKFYDLYPENNKVLEQNFLSLESEYKQGRLIIGNPPFGSRNSLIIKFFKKAITLGDYVAFILPISQLNNVKQLYEFDLVYSEDLGIEEYSGVDLHCCFNIYKRPESGKLNKKVKIEVDGLNVIEYRRDKEGKYLKKVKDGYFLSICSWGSGLGKSPEYVGQYAMELYFYSEDDTIKDIVSNIDWWNEISCISAKKLPKGLAMEIINNKLNCCQEDKGEFNE